MSYVIKFADEARSVLLIIWDVENLVIVAE